MLTTLQAGRAFAAMAVVAFHLSIFMSVDRYGGIAVFEPWTRHGNLGVDFFFVLSGFVILMAHARDIGQPSKVGQYIWKRFVRVYPIYLVYTLTFATLVLAGLGANSTMPATWEGWISTITLVRLSPESPPLAPAWTLFHEVGFYALFSILIISRRVGIAVLASWLLACIALWQYPGEINRTAFAVYLSAYSLHFALGMAAFAAYDRLRNYQWISAVFGLTAMIGAAAAWALLPGGRTLFTWACGFAGVLLAAVSVERSTGGGLVPAWLRHIGDASYSLYLLHLPVMGALLKVAQKLKLQAAIGPESTFLVVFAGTVAAACLAYRLIEHPLLGRLRRSKHA